MTTLIVALVAIAAGFTLGCLFGGWLTSEARLAKNHVFLLGKAVSKDFNAFHERIVALEQSLLHKSEAVKKDLVN